MNVHVLIREDRNEHGYIDTSVIGVFAERRSARLERRRQRRQATAEGYDVNMCDWPGSAHLPASKPPSRLESRWASARAWRSRCCY